MKMRLMGASTEMPKVVEELRNTFNVRSVSKDYPNRGNSTDVRVYVDFEMKEPDTIELSEKEVEVLKESLNDDLEMFKTLNETFNTKETYHLYMEYESLYDRLCLSEVGFSKEIEIDKVGIMNLLSSLSMYAEREIIKVKNRGENPRENEYCLFLNDLYLKLNKKFLSM